MWSVYGHVVLAAVVLLVRGRVSRLLVGLFGVGCLALQQALAQPDLVLVGARLVSVLVGASCVGPAWSVFAVRRLPTVGEKSNDKWFDRCKKFSNSCHFPCPARAALHAQPIIWYFAVPFERPFSFACAIHMYTPVGGKAPSVSLGASPCSTWEPQGDVPSPVRCSCSCLPACRAPYRCLAGYVAGVSVSQC